MSTTSKRLLIVGIAAAILFGILAFYNKNKSEAFTAPAGMPDFTNSGPIPGPFNKEGTKQYKATKEVIASAPGAPGPIPKRSINQAPVAWEGASMEKHMPTGVPDASVGKSFKETFPNDTITPSELLPKDATNTQWAQMNPAGQGDVRDQNFLTAGYMLGYNTQGSSNRNASHDLRAEPANPRRQVSIWQQSTIDPDLNRRPLN